MHPKQLHLAKFAQERQAGKNNGFAATLRKLMSHDLKYAQFLSSQLDDILAIYWMLILVNLKIVQKRYSLTYPSDFLDRKQKIYDVDSRGISK